MPTIDQQFAEILKEIHDQAWSHEDWAGHEAGDWFQTDNFCGGFEADETYQNGEFNFSYYDEVGKEWWFTFRLDQVAELSESGFKSLELCDPETYQ